MKAHYLIFSLVFACTLFLAACTSGNRSKTPTGDPDAVPVSKALYHNPDSLLRYAKLAYLHDDPKGLYVTAVAAFLRAQDPNFPDSCTTVPLEEARIMLQHSADLGYPDAIKSLRCLQKHGQWGSDNTETK